MPPEPRPDLLALAAYVGGASTLANTDRTVIKLSSNEGAFGPPDAAIEAHRAAAGRLHRYPDGGSAALREALGRRHGIDPARIVCDTGSDPIFSLLALAYAGPRTEVLISAHGFAIYEIAATKSGAATVRAAERDLTTDVDAILRAVTPRTRIVMIANPNNPTGTMIDASEVERLRAGLPDGVLLVLDAAYAEYVTDPAYDPGIALATRTGNTIMTRTFSKAYGLGGARLGWAYGPPAVIDVLNRIREPFGVNLAVQAAGLAALEEPGWIERVRGHNARERDRLARALDAIGLPGTRSEANFLLVDFGTEARARAADAVLRDHAILVRSTASYGLPAHLRITIGRTAEVDAVLAALRAFVQSEGGG